MDHILQDTLAALTTRERKYLDLYVNKAMSKTRAAHEAGFSSPPKGKAVMEAQIQMERAAAKKMVVDLDTVQRGLGDAIDIARVKGDPGAMVQAYKEQARLAGLDPKTEGPTQVNILQLTKDQVQSLPYEQLLRLMPEELKKDVLEGDFSRVIPHDRD
jgi:hypothetical protein